MVESDDRRSGLQARHPRSSHERLRPLKWLAALGVWAGLWWLADRGPLWPGALVAVLGQAVQLWAAGVLPIRKTSGLCDAGPYALVRNPMYIGRFLLGLGLALLTWRWPIVVAFAVLFAAYAHLRVRREERRLRDALGEEYDEYCRRVPRWVPRLGVTTPAGRWSFASANRYGQLMVTAALLLIVASLVVRRVWL
jgi:protein-S-isoprenylcysteine O-methyltransferase Ste14